MEASCYVVGKMLIQEHLVYQSYVGCVSAPNLGLILGFLTSLRPHEHIARLFLT